MEMTIFGFIDGVRRAQRHIVKVSVVLAGVFVLASTGQVRASGPHVHGVASLEVAQEGVMLTLRLESPLDNLLGFERAPRTDKERDAVRAMAATLRDAAKVFAIDPDAGCVLQSVRLESGVIDGALLGKSDPQGVRKDGAAQMAKRESVHGHEGHAEMEAGYVFNCTYPERLNSVNVVLFDTFKGFRRIDARIVTEKRQSAARVTPRSRRIDW